LGWKYSSNTVYGPFSAASPLVFVVVAGGEMPLALLWVTRCGVTERQSVEHTRRTALTASTAESAWRMPRSETSVVPQLLFHPSGHPANN
jgi:hypothetical protein